VVPRRHAVRGRRPQRPGRTLARSPGRRAALHAANYKFNDSGCSTTSGRTSGWWMSPPGIDAAHEAATTGTTSDRAVGRRVRPSGSRSCPIEAARRFRTEPQHRRLGRFERQRWAADEKSPITATGEQFTALVPDGQDASPVISSVPEKSHRGSGCAERGPGAASRPALTARSCSFWTALARAGRERSISRTGVKGTKPALSGGISRRGGPRPSVPANHRAFSSTSASLRTPLRPGPSDCARRSQAGIRVVTTRRISTICTSRLSGRNEKTYHAPERPRCGSNCRRWPVGRRVQRATAGTSNGFFMNRLAGEPAGRIPDP